MPVSAKKPIKPSSSVVKELQRTAAFVAYETVFYDDDMDDKEKQVAIYNKCHGLTANGNPAPDSVVGFLDQMVDGTAPFSGLYDREDVTNNAQSNTSRTEGVRLVLKPELHREFHKVYVIDENVTKQVVSQGTLTSSARATGRLLMTHAKTALRNGKKALAIAEAWIQNNGINPSGTRDEDYQKEILDKMYIQLMGADDIGTDDSSGDDEAEAAPSSSSKRPEGWTFPGFMAFMVLGPMGSKSEFYNSKDATVGKGGKKANGRAAQRENC